MFLLLLTRPILLFVMTMLLQTPSIQNPDLADQEYQDPNWFKWEIVGTTRTCFERLIWEAVRIKMGRGNCEEITMNNKDEFGSYELPELVIDGAKKRDMLTLMCPPKYEIDEPYLPAIKRLRKDVPRLDPLELQRQSQVREEIRGGRLWTWNVLEDIILDKIKNDGSITALGRTGPTSHLQAITCLGVEGPPVKMSTIIYLNETSIDDVRNGRVRVCPPIDAGKTESEENGHEKQRNAMCPPDLDQSRMKDVRCPPKESVGKCPSVPESELCLPVPGLDQSSMKDVRCPPKESVGICPPVPERELCLPVPNVKTRLDSLELQRQS